MWFIKLIWFKMSICNDILTLINTTFLSTYNIWKATNSRQRVEFIKPCFIHTFCLSLHRIRSKWTNILNYLRIKCNMYNTDCLFFLNLSSYVDAPQSRSFFLRYKLPLAKRGNFKQSHNLTPVTLLLFFFEF